MSCRAAYRHAQKYGGRVIGGDRYRADRDDRSGRSDEDRGRAYGERYQRYEREHGDEYRRRWDKPRSP
jgi:hypothetical protein